MSGSIDGRQVPASHAPKGQGAATTLCALIGLSLGPSAIAVLSFGVFVRPIQAEFGWSRVEVSLAATIMSYVIMAVSPLQGFLIDRYGVRRLVLFSIPTFAAALAAFYFQPASLPAFYLLWAIIPLAAIGLWPLGYLKAVSSWFDRRLGLALGVANAGIGIGGALVPLAMTMLISAYGWRSAFLALAGVVLAVTLPAAFLGVKECAPSAGAATGRAEGLDFRPGLRAPAFLPLAITFFLLGLTTTALITQQAPMLIDAGWSPQRAALVQAVFGVALMGGRIGVGYAIDRLFAPVVMAAVTLGGALGCLIFALAPQTQWAFLAATLVGLTVGAEFDVLALLIKRYFGTLAFGKFYGLVFAVFQLASGLGIAGLSLSQSHLGGYRAGLSGFAVVLALSAIIFVTLPPYRFAKTSADRGPVRTG